MFRKVQTTYGLIVCINSACRERLCRHHAMKGCTQTLDNNTQQNTRTGCAQPRAIAFNRKCAWLILFRRNSFCPQASSVPVRFVHLTYRATTPCGAVPQVHAHASAPHAVFVCSTHVTHTDDNRCGWCLCARALARKAFFCGLHYVCGVQCPGAAERVGRAHSKSPLHSKSAFSSSLRTHRHR